MKIFIGADHRGFALKEKLKPWLVSLGHEVVDLGAHQNDQNDDYPDFSFAVAERVVADGGGAISGPGSSLKVGGIVICGSGVGITIAANRVKGARCSTAISEAEAKLAREDDDLNVLAISGDFTSEEQAKKFITIFLETPFKGDERHLRRLRKIEARER